MCEWRVEFTKVINNIIDPWKCINTITIIIINDDDDDNDDKKHHSPIKKQKINNFIIFHKQLTM